ncbi:MAG TPA: amino acid adenylation domain-containing protein [Pseudonocardiaceae bacterium]|nr:amino acid adenylation domain-containing protein [Pseudonocardiaceae bacterium]
MALAGKRITLPAEPVAHRPFEQHAKSHPDRLALTCGGERRSYRELDSQANQFAHHLISRGVGRGSIVGVCLDRSPELMVSILGILKAGATYVPLDPTYPPERLRIMRSQLPQMALIAVTQATLDLVDDSSCECLDVPAMSAQLNSLPTTAPAVEITGDDLCYVVFTSGSTGTPKATAIRHEGWYNLLRWLDVEYDLGSHSSNLMISSFGFDISQRSLMTPLFTGAPLHLLPSRSFDIAMAYRIIGELGVRTLHCAPSTLYLLIDREMGAGGNALTGVDYVFIGGEPLSASRVVDWATREGNDCVLLHQYGVAECTDVASSHVMADYPAYLTGALPAGEPVYNTTIQVLDADLNEVPDGAVGEICITGVSVGAGYLNAAPMDREKFTTVQRDNRDVRLYRTGDKGYATPSGELVVVGRLDAQVKVRGMRIDLGDIEHTIRGHPDVRDAVVIPVNSERGETSLVSFVIATDGRHIEDRAFRRDLLEILPRNMVPQEFIEVQDFPLNPNGKIDRRALANGARATIPTVDTPSR